MSGVEVAGRGGTVYDDPNRESVGLEPAWVEGTGGGPGAEVAPAGGDDGLDALTKAELLEKAQQMGVSPANNDMTKAELVAGIRGV